MMVRKLFIILAPILVLVSCKQRKSNSLASLVTPEEELKILEYSRAFVMELNGAATSGSSAPQMMIDPNISAPTRNFNDEIQKFLEAKLGGFNMEAKKEELKKEIIGLPSVNATGILRISFYRWAIDKLVPYSGDESQIGVRFTVRELLSSYLNILTPLTKMGAARELARLIPHAYRTISRESPSEAMDYTQRITNLMYNYPSVVVRFLANNINESTYRNEAVFHVLSEADFASFDADGSGLHPVFNQFSQLKPGVMAPIFYFLLRASVVTALFDTLVGTMSEHEPTIPNLVLTKSKFAMEFVKMSAYFRDHIPWPQLRDRDDKKVDSFDLFDVYTGKVNVISEKTLNNWEKSSQTTVEELRGDSLSVYPDLETMLTIAMTSEARRTRLAEKTLLDELDEVQKTEKNDNSDMLTVDAVRQGLPLAIPRNSAQIIRRHLDRPNGTILGAAQIHMMSRSIVDEVYKAYDRITIARIYLDRVGDRDISRGLKVQAGSIKCPPSQDAGWLVKLCSRTSYGMDKLSATDYSYVTKALLKYSDIELKLPTADEYVAFFKSWVYEDPEFGEVDLSTVPNESSLGKIKLSAQSSAQQMDKTLQGYRDSIFGKFASVTREQLLGKVSAQPTPDQEEQTLQQVLEAMLSGKGGGPSVYEQAIPTSFVNSNTKQETATQCFPDKQLPIYFEQNANQTLSPRLLRNEKFLALAFPQYKTTMWTLQQFLNSKARYVKNMEASAALAGATNAYRNSGDWITRRWTNTMSDLIEGGEDLTTTYGSGLIFNHIGSFFGDQAVGNYSHDPSSLRRALTPDAFTNAKIAQEKFENVVEATLMDYSFQTARLACFHYWAASDAEKSQLDNVNMCLPSANAPFQLGTLCRGGLSTQRSAYDPSRSVPQDGFQLEKLIANKIAERKDRDLTEMKKTLVVNTGFEIAMTIMTAKVVSSVWKFGGKLTNSLGATASQETLQAGRASSMAKSLAWLGTTRAGALGFQITRPIIDSLMFPWIHKSFSFVANAAFVTNPENMGALYKTLWDSEKSLAENLEAYRDEFALGAAMFMVQPFVARFGDKVWGRAFGIKSGNHLKAVSGKRYLGVTTQFNSEYVKWYQRLGFIATVGAVDGAFFALTPEILDHAYHLVAGWYPHGYYEKHEMPMDHRASWMSFLTAYAFRMDMAWQGHLMNYQARHNGRLEARLRSQLGNLSQEKLALMDQKIRFSEAERKELEASLTDVDRKWEISLRDFVLMNSKPHDDLSPEAVGRRIEAARQHIMKYGTIIENGVRLPSTHPSTSVYLDPSVRDSLVSEVSHFTRPLFPDVRMPK